MAEKQVLFHLQLLRGVAALMVVLHHILDHPDFAASPWRDTHIGRLGVLIFFVISGFIMQHACRDARAGEFLRRRLIRIVPLYWLTTLVFMLLLLRRDIADAEPLRRAGDLVAALMFVPKWHIALPDRIWPVLVQGWTLNFEMFFYLIFALGLALGRGSRVALGLLLTFALAGALLRPASAPGQTWTSPLLMLFAAGLGLGWLWIRRITLPALVLLPAAVLMGLLAQDLPVAAGKAGWQTGWPEPADWPWTLLAYLTASLMVAGTLALDARDAALRRLPAPLHRAGLLLGDASYAVYLSHSLSLVAAMPLLLALPFDGGLQATAVILSALALATTFGIALHLWVERPITRALLGQGSLRKVQRHESLQDRGDMARK